MQIMPTISPALLPSVLSAENRHPATMGGLPEKDKLVFLCKVVGGVVQPDSIGESTYLVNRLNDGNNIQVFGYCPTFDGSAGQYISGSQILGNETISDWGGTSETLTVATGKVTPSAGTVEWFEFSDGRKYILQSSKTARQSKFWNVNGNIVDSVTLVGLTAPYCTTKSLSAPLLDGFIHEENLVGVPSIGHESEPSSAARVRGSGNVTFGVPSGALAGFDGEVIYGDNSVLRYCQWAGSNDDNTVYLTAYVAMDDGLAPVPGAFNSASADFTFQIRDSVLASGYTVTAVGGGVYKVSVSRTGTGSNNRFGVYKYTTNSARTFRVTRIHIHVNPDAAYRKAHYEESVALYNTGIAESFTPIRAYNTSTAKIVAIGDSLTAENYPKHFLQIFSDATIVDAGVSGNTTAQMLARFQADAIAPAPDYITYFGIVNSVVGGISAASIISDINGMIALAAAAGIPMVIGTGTPFGSNVNWSEARQAVMNTVNAYILALDHPTVIATVDLFTPLLAAGSEVNLIAIADTGDGLHITATGDTAVARLMSLAIPIRPTNPPTMNMLSATFEPGVIALNAPSAIESADVDNRWFAVDHSANDVEPTTIPINAGDKIFKGPSGLVFYSSALTGSNITKAERYVD